MISVMLVDDEELATAYLEQMIDWEKNGYHIIGCASNGWQALELYEKYSPQIVISDIRMPGMDGLELVRRLKDKNLNVAVILMSAYKDFEYAQKGIQYGVSNYLLKHELSEQTILAELNAVRKKLNKEKERKTIYQRYLMNRLINGQQIEGGIDDIHPGNRLFLLLLHKNSYILHGEFVETEWESQEKEMLEEIFSENIPEQCTYVSDVPVTGNNWVVLYQLEPIASKYTVNCLIEQKSVQIVKRLSSLPELHIQVLYSYEIALHEISHTFRQMAWQIRYACFREPDKAYALTSLPQIVPKEKFPLGSNIKKLRDVLYKEKYQASHLIQEWFTAIDREQQLDSFRALLPILEQLFQEMENCSTKQKRLWTVKETGEYYADCFAAIQTQLYEQELKNYSKPVTDLLRYLRRHYNEDLSLNTLGEIFQMNGAYLNQIVRKETGHTILKHVTNLRIEKAKQFLYEENYTVAKTAYCVGYQTSQYFSQIFTKTVGVSPQEYKKWEEKNQKNHN